MSGVCQACIFAVIVTERMDPLAAIWLANVSGICKAWNQDCTMMRGSYPRQILGNPDYVAQIYTNNFGAIYEFASDRLSEFGQQTGLWSCSEPDIYEDATSVWSKFWCKRSNVFIEKAASRAFLYMRPFVGKDVASVIARMLAKLYLADMQWIKHENIKGRLNLETIRNRITFWLDEDVKKTLPNA